MFSFKRAHRLCAVLLLKFKLFLLGFAAGTGQMEPSAASVFVSGAASVTLAHPWVSWVTSCERFRNGMCLSFLAVFPKAKGVRATNHCNTCTGRNVSRSAAVFCLMLDASLAYKMYLGIKKFSVLTFPVPVRWYA